jgi:hypothetical protein
MIQSLPKSPSAGNQAFDTEPFGGILHIQTVTEKKMKKLKIGQLN